MRRLGPWMIWSLAAAVGSAAAGLAGLGYGGAPTRLVPLSFLLSAVWLVMVMAAIIRLRLRGLWLLTGSPFALAMLVVVVLFAQAIGNCTANHPARDCLP